MTAIRRRRLVVAAGLAVLPLLAGCATAVSGTGRAIIVPTPSLTTPGGFPATTPAQSPTGAPPAPTTGGASPTSGPPTGLTRRPAQTALGDPLGVDFCAPLHVDAYRTFGVNPHLPTVRYLPGCEIDFGSRGTYEFSVDVAAVPPGTSSQVPGSTHRTEAGLRVVVAPYQKDLGDCERDVLARGVTLTVDVYAGTQTPKRPVACRLSDTMTAQVAGAVHAGSLPSLRLAAPSVTALDPCRVLDRAGVSALPAFGGAPRPSSYGFGGSCSLHGTGATLYVSDLIDSLPVPVHTRRTVEAGHVLYAAHANSSTYCSLVSIQGAAGSAHEELSFSSLPKDYRHPAKGLCAQTAAAAARYLVAAGLH